MRFFYSDSVNSSSTKATLNSEDSRHCIKVLRLKKQDQIQLVDGKGGSYIAEIVGDSVKSCEVRITQYEQVDSPSFNNHIIMAPTKSNDRTEWFIEKAVEIGVQEISFFFSKYSERKTLNMERIKRIAISAMKQSKQFYLPQLNPIEQFSEKFLKPCSTECDKFLAWTSEQSDRHLFYENLSHKHSCIIVGPEGGFAEEEVQLAKDYGFQTVSLGRNRLRTETAALVATELLALKRLPIR